jgi:ribA/ribD-fused uncharacterized protein
MDQRDEEKEKFEVEKIKEYIKSCWREGLKEYRVFEIKGTEKIKDNLKLQTSKALEELLGANEASEIHISVEVDKQDPQKLNVNFYGPRYILRKLEGMTGKIEILEFKDEYEFLSNFYYSPFTYKDKKYSTVEHAYQSFKTLDERQRNRIWLAESPNRAKRLGRQVDVREDWEDIKLGLMLDLVRAKFQQNPKLAQRLIGTGNANLVEGNNWGDTYWGACQGWGENHLGKILMQVRDEMQEDK